MSKRTESVLRRLKRKEEPTVCEPRLHDRNVYRANRTFQDVSVLTDNYVSLFQL